MIKKIGFILLVIAIIIQFVRPNKNVSDSVSNINNIPQPIWQDLKVACYDCHSNNTIYPWYSHIQPVAWWLNRHIVHGKKQLNFDNKISNKQYAEIIEVIEENSMPLFSYTLLHKKAKLSGLQRKAIVNWAEQANLTNYKTKNDQENKLEEEQEH